MLECPTTEGVNILSKDGVSTLIRELSKLSADAYKSSPLIRHIAGKKRIAHILYQRMILLTVAYSGGWVTAIEKKGEVVATAWWLQPEAKTPWWLISLNLLMVLLINPRYFINSVYSVLQVEKISKKAKKEYKNYSFIMLTNMVVKKDWQRRGLAKELLEPVLELADNEGMIVYLECEEHNIAFYKKFGFKVYSEILLRDKKVKYYSMIRLP